MIYWTYLHGRKLLYATLIVTAQVGAAGLVQPDAQLRSDLAWLTDRGVINLSLSTWPLSQDEIERSIAAQKTKNDDASRRVISRVEQRLAELKSVIRLNGWSQSSRSSLPSTFSSLQQSAHGVGATLSSSGEAWDISIHSQLESHQYIEDTSRTNLNNAYAGVQFFNQWLAFGELAQWWGPGNDGSTIRSDAARPVVGFMLQRAEQSPFETPWLSWMGSWQYQLSAGQLRQYQRPEEPKLIGGRLTLNPANSVELGASRIMLWGGKGRPQTAHSFGDAFIGRDNTGSQERDPGDQLGGIDFRMKLSSLVNLPLSLYGQVAGEDQAGILPSHNLFLVGLEGHTAWGNTQINGYLEGADTRSGMNKTGIIYYHYCYQQGYYQQGYPLGDAMGGDGRRYSGKIEWVLENQQRLSTRLVWMKVNPTSQTINHAYPNADTIKGTELAWSVPLGKATISAGLWYAQRDTGHTKGISTSFELPLF